MSITSVEGVELARRSGVDRVTLARELSLDEVRRIREQTDCDLEIFVHGALCVAYSGQCFSSEAWGGRSANRGQCAQACRLPYDLMVDGRHRPLADARYLLSPGDLYALHHIPEIVAIGISAVKIEGRYKEADYVALATRAYRKAVDEAWAGLPQSVTAVEDLQLEQVYSRGLGPFFLGGTDHQAVVSGRAPGHRGVQVGRVHAIGAGAVLIDPAPAHDVAPLEPGDGLVFDAADWRSPAEPEEGGRVYSVDLRAGKLELRFGRDAIDFSRVRPGDLVWRTHDPEIDRLAKPYLEATAPMSRQPVAIRVAASPGRPLVTEWSLVDNPAMRVTVESPGPLGAAQRRAMDRTLLEEQLGRLGNTPYELASLDLDVHDSPFAPASLLNQMRRDAVERLQALQREPKPAALCEPTAILRATLAAILPAPREANPAAQLHLLVRTPEQLEAALALAPASITLDYLDLYGLRPSVERVKASGIPCRVASPRILKPGEERIVEFLLRLDCEILVRSGGLLERLRGGDHSPLTGDFSLNAANSITADLLLRLGLARITPTHDLNAAQVAELARAVGPGRIEAIAYQHLPVFHTEHCVFARFLSDGKSYKDCGRPCEEHRVSLRDIGGRAHPLMADVGCRNTVFGAEAQEASAHLTAWRAAGIHHLRLEFVHESADEVSRVTRAFAAALEANSCEGLSSELKRIAPQGTTQGSLFVSSNYLELPVLQ